MNESAFRENILSLIDDLSSVNEEIDKTRDRNERLIALLKDCLEHEGR